MKTIFLNYKSVLVNGKYKHLMHTNSLSYIYYLPVWHLLLIVGVDTSTSNQKLILTVYLENSWRHRMIHIQVEEQN